MALTVGQKHNNLSWVSEATVYIIGTGVGSEVSDGGVQGFVQKGTLSEEFQLIQALSNFACECSVAGWVGVIFEG